MDAINEDGYLEQSLEELAAMLPLEQEIDPLELQTALKLVQHLDPLGVGAHTAGAGGRSRRPVDHATICLDIAADILLPALLQQIGGRRKVGEEEEQGLDAEVPWPASWLCRSFLEIARGK